MNIRFAAKFLLPALGLGIFFGCAGKGSRPQAEISQSAVEKPQSAVEFSVETLDGNREIRHVALADTLSLPTLAALDFAAYYKNPVREAGKSELPENAKPVTDFGEYPFPMLDTIMLTLPQNVSSLAPIAWEPFTKFLAAKNASGADSLANALREIESVKWGQPNVFADFQKVEALYLSENSWWVEVSPRPWTGLKTFWGRLKVRADSADAEGFKAYTSETLSFEAATDWARSLAAYWYPAYNTDLEPQAMNWETANPFAVMRGNPMGTPMLIAFDVRAFRRLTLPEEKALDPKTQTRELDTSSTWRLEALEKLQGVCPDLPEVELFRKRLAARLDALPAEQNAFAAGGMLWFRRNANSLLTADFSGQDSLHDPFTRLLELKAFLDAEDIQLLVVPIPVKEALYADRLDSAVSDTLCVDVAGRKFVRDLLAAGVDVLDVYPAMRAARAADTDGHYSFEKFDTHWALNAELAALEEIASKVTSYAWYENSGAKPGTLEMRDTTITREGDLIIQMPTAEQGLYAAETLEVKKIYRDGKPYVGGKSSPILLMGDSFTGVFESIDGKSGGPASLLAFATGLDVQVLTSWGGGPGVRHRMAKDKKTLMSKRLVIYMMTMRDFWQSPMEWDAL